MTDQLTLPPTYALPVMVANPNRSSKLTRLISIIKSSPGVTGDFHLSTISSENDSIYSSYLTPFTPVKKKIFWPPSCVTGGERQMIPPS